MEKENLKDKVFIFKTLKEIIKKKLGEEQGILNLRIQALNKRFERNKLISDIFCNSLIFIILLLIIAILGGILFYPVKIDGFLWKKTCELFVESYSMANSEVYDPINVVIYAFGGLGTGIGFVVFTIACICGTVLYGIKSKELFEDTMKKINFIKKKFTLKKSKQIAKDQGVIKQKLQNIQAIFENFDKVDECYEYMIHSSLVHKNFSEKEVQLLFELLMEGYDINSLIYLLYHDRLQEFKKMSLYDRQELIDRIDIDNNIAYVKECSIQLEQARQQEFEQTGVYKRKRRTAKLYDDKIEEYNTQIESLANNFGAKRS